MPKVVGGLMALAALAASMMSGVGPLDCLMRGAAAYLIGMFATQVWYVFFTIRMQREPIGGMTEPTSSNDEAVRAAG